MTSHYIFFSWTLSLLLMSTGSEGVEFSGSEGALVNFGGADPPAIHVIAEDDTERSIPEINEDTQMRGNDIKRRPSGDRNARRDPASLWNLPIPIKFSKKLSLMARTAIMEGIREFELLTCITFVNHTIEEDFIHIKPLEGCYSSVGKVGGEQELSLGPGCWTMSTVIHETMHALGFNHEQSRADRDLYLRIIFENIKKDNAYNFEKLKYVDTDDHRVPYDYYSVMQYNGYGFAKEKGQTTMRTLNSHFQSVIGRRQGFSEGDVTKINRHYSCSDTSRVSYVCDFEDPGICGYVIKYNGWKRQPAVVTSGLANPQTDATFGKLRKGHFMVFNSSLLANETMWSPYYISKVENQCLQFSYYIDRAANSAAYLRVSYGKFNTTTGEVDSEEMTDVGVITNYVPRTWNVYRRTIRAPSDYKLALYATAGSHDVVAIDDVSVTDRACDTSYFTIHDVSGVWASHPSKLDHFFSPMMYTDDGYGFVLSIYPNGNEGYMSVFFHLVYTANVDNLSWPFHNRIIRITITDPRTDVTKQANRYIYFEAKASGGTSWEKPVKDIVNRGLGFFNAFNNSEAMAVYVKHNSLTFSVEVSVPNQLRELKPNKFPTTTTTETTTTTASSSSTTTTVGITQPPTTSGVSNLSSSIHLLSTLLFMVVASVVMT